MAPAYHAPQDRELEAGRLHVTNDLYLRIVDVCGWPRQREWLAPVAATGSRASASGGLSAGRLSREAGRRRPDRVPEMNLLPGRAVVVTYRRNIALYIIVLFVVALWFRPAARPRIRAKSQPTSRPITRCKDSARRRPRRGDIDGDPEAETGASLEMTIADLDLTSKHSKKRVKPTSLT